MLVILQLFWEFFKTGLFSIGGGLATLPFLYDIAEKYTWFDAGILPDMVAISESTPGPIGINMATYAGFNAVGILGALVATVALALPSFLIIICVSGPITKVKDSLVAQSVLRTLRPAVTALIAFAGWLVMEISLFHFPMFEKGGFWAVFDIKALILFAILWFLIEKTKKHPIFFILGAAVVGIILKF